MEYANIAAESEGTATSKYNAAYLDSIEAKVNELTAAWQGFSMSLLDTTAIKNVVDMLSMFVSWLDAIVSVGDGQLLPFLVAIPIVLATVRKAFKDTGNAALTTGQKIAQGLKNSIPVVIPTILALIATFDNAEAKISIAVIGIATAVITALTLITMAVKKFEMSNPIGWILAAISAVLMAIQAIIDLIPSYEKSKKAAEEARAAWDENSQALEENSSKIEELKSELEELNSIENKSITDENDIMRLEREIALLNERNAVLKKQEENSKSTAADAAVEAYQLLAYGKITDTELEGAEGAKHWMKANDLEMSSEELVNYALSNWNAIENGAAVIPDSVRTFVTGYLNEVNTLTDGLEHGIDPTLDRILDITDRANEVFYLQEEGIEAYWQNLGLKSEYANGIETIEDFANEFKKSTDITGRALKDFAKDNADAMAIFEHLKEVGAWDGKNWESLAAYVQDLRIGLGELAELSISDDIELVSAKFDALSNAITEAKENGILSLDTLKTLMEETPSELDEYFEKVADGYGLKEQYQNLSSFDLLREVAMAEIKEQQEALATAQENLKDLTEEDDDYEMAQKNLATAQDNLNTKTMEWATILKDLKVEEETEKLEARQEALEKELDIYKELVDIRKDILETYKEEESYQKELNRKQNTVATLEAQLAAARLDDSAAGQAKQRALEAELDEAQEELDEYTLEHAIQDITVSMDNEYAEYEAFIQEEVEKITNQIEGIATTVKDILGEVEGFVLLSDGASDMYYLYEQIKTSDGLSLGGSETSQSKFMEAMQNNDYVGAAEYYRDTSSWYNENKPTEPETTTPEPETNKISPNDLTEIQGAQAYNFNYKDVNDFGHIAYEGSKYRLERAAVGSDELLAVAKEKGLGERAVFKYGNNVYAMTDGGNHVIKLKDRKGLVGDQLQYFKNATGIFHQGGFIGDFMALKSNEQFAKLLKGEFVTTPAQMDNFMKKVLPQITSYSNGATINNNSPLIAIQCGSINDETLPKLTEMVDAAVAQIERNMENALTRRGYRGRV